MARRFVGTTLHVSTNADLYWQPHYPASVIDPWLERRTPSGYLEPIDRGVIFVAQVRDLVVGFSETGIGTIEALFVEPAFAKRGVGRALLLHAVDRIRTGHDGLIRLESTLNACGFYERHGFREIGRSTIKRNRTDIAVVVMQTDHAVRIAPSA